VLAGWAERTERKWREVWLKIDEMLKFEVERSDPPSDEFFESREYTCFNG